LISSRDFQKSLNIEMSLKSAGWQPSWYTAEWKADKRKLTGAFREDVNALKKKRTTESSSSSLWRPFIRTN